jgi:hypothetical protein
VGDQHLSPSYERPTPDPLPTMLLTGTNQYCWRSAARPVASRGCEKLLSASRSNTHPIDLSVPLAYKRLQFKIDEFAEVGITCKTVGTWCLAIVPVYSPGGQNGHHLMGGTNLLGLECECGGLYYSVPQQRVLVRQEHLRSRWHLCR